MDVFDSARFGLATEGLDFRRAGCAAALQPVLESTSGAMAVQPACELEGPASGSGFSRYDSQRVWLALDSLTRGVGSHTSTAPKHWHLGDLSYAQFLALAQL